MGLKPKFHQDEIKKRCDLFFSRVEDAIELSLSRRGEIMIRDARETGSFTDRSGNLRSANGYVVFKNSKLNTLGIDNSGNQEGKSESESELLKKKSGVLQGFTFIAINGMSYAPIVESRGYTVLTASWMAASQNITRDLRVIRNKLSK